MPLVPSRNGGIARHSSSNVPSSKALCFIAIALAFEAMVALGCASLRPVSPSVIPVSTSASVCPARARDATPPIAPSSDVSVSGELASICNVDFDDIESAPKFDFARSDLLAEDGEVLAQIARCVTTGTLAGRALILVGRADSRGESEYNMVLGERRASSVRAHLVDLGVASSRLTATSRGNIDATGTDSLGWLRDRRVDISLR